MNESQKETFKAVISRMVGFLSKITARLSRWIGDLQYYSFMIDFGNRKDDIWVATFMKSGTTLAQMMLYQLTTDGNMDFKHINDVCPWVRNAAIRNLKPPAIPSPRILKTHDPYDSFDSDTRGKFIFVIRDGMDVAASYYHHRKNYNNPNLTFDELFQSHFEKKGELNWFTFTQKWLENKNNFPILYLKYEDILNDFDNTLKKVIGFCNLKVDDKIIARVKERCSFQFMKQHEEKFGIERWEEKRVYNQFIRKGKPGEGKEQMSREQIELFKTSFEKNLGTLNTSLGFDYHFDYPDLLNKPAQEVVKT